MTRDAIVNAIEKVLRENMQSAHLAAFTETARLNEDLYLDSVLTLQLILHLELDLGLSVPDGNLSKHDYATVASLADFLARVDNTQLANEIKEQPPAQQEFEDVKVHCFVSCVCELLKRACIDHRPFYFGVWDAEFTINEHYQLCYHSSDIDHHSFRAWYQRLYGVAVQPWYEETASKAANVDRLMSLLTEKEATQHVMVMLDMYQLPERDNKFSQNPFPHYVMLQHTADPERLYMSDPDFRWEGELPTQRIVNAIIQPTVAGGYWFDEKDAKPACNRDIQAYFIACFLPDANPLTAAIRTIVHAHLDEDKSLTLEQLTFAVREIRVIAVRKYAYEHGLAFFWRALGLNDDDFENWCDVIEDLIQTYSRIQYQIMKLAETKDMALVKRIDTLLDKQNRTENTIKRRLYEVYQDWCELNDLPLMSAAKEG